MSGFGRYSDLGSTGTFDGATGGGGSVGNNGFGRFAVLDSTESFDTAAAETGNALENAISSSLSGVGQIAPTETLSFQSTAETAFTLKNGNVIVTGKEYGGNAWLNLLGTAFGTPVEDTVIVCTGAGEQENTITANVIQKTISNGEVVNQEVESDVSLNLTQPFANSTGMLSPLKGFTNSNAAIEETNEVKMYKIGNSEVIANQDGTVIYDNLNNAFIPLVDSSGTEHLIHITSITEDSITFYDNSPNNNSVFSSNVMTYLLLPILGIPYSPESLATADTLSYLLSSGRNNSQEVTMTAEQFTEMFGENAASVGYGISGDNIIQIEGQTPDEIRQDLSADLSSLVHTDLELSYDDLYNKYSISNILNGIYDIDEERILYVPNIDETYANIIEDIIDNFSSSREKIAKKIEDIKDILIKTGKPFDNDLYKDKLSKIDSILNNINKSVTSESKEDIVPVIRQYNKNLLADKKNVRDYLIRKAAEAINNKNIVISSENKTYSSADYIRTGEIYDERGTTKTVIKKLSNSDEAASSPEAKVTVYRYISTDGTYEDIENRFIIAEIHECIPYTIKNIVDM